MAANGGISHNRNMANQVSANWWVIGENVGVGYDVGGLMDGFVASSSHYANIVDSGYTHVGVGVVWGGDGRLYTAHNFMGIEGGGRAGTRTGTGTGMPRPEPAACGTAAAGGTGRTARHRAAAHAAPGVPADRPPRPPWPRSPRRRPDPSASPPCSSALHSLDLPAPRRRRSGRPRSASQEEQLHRGGDEDRQQQQRQRDGGARPHRSAPRRSRAGSLTPASSGAG